MAEHAANSSRVASRATASRPVSTTLAPSASNVAAMALPIPRDEPATSATLFSMPRFMRQRYTAVQPPSTIRFWPVTYELASEARNTSAPQSSIGRPMRCRTV